MAFTVAAPVSGGEAAGVEYVGVRPDRWGAGLARGNLRAVVLYDQLGWQPHGAPWPHPRTRKPQQRYRLVLTGQPGPRVGTGSQGH